MKIKDYLGYEIVVTPNGKFCAGTSFEGTTLRAVEKQIEDAAKPADEGAGIACRSYPSLMEPTKNLGLSRGWRDITFKIVRVKKARSKYSGEKIMMVTDKGEEVNIAFRDNSVKLAELEAIGKKAQLFGERMKEEFAPILAEYEAWQKSMEEYRVTVETFTGAKS